MQLKLTNTEGEYDFSKWVVDLSGLRFRVSYTDRYGQPGQETQGDRKEAGRNIVLSYSVNSETDAGYIVDAETLYAALRAEVAPFFLVDEDNNRRLEVSPDTLDLNARPGTGNRFGKSTCGSAEDCAFALGARLWLPEGDPIRHLGIPGRATKGVILVLS